MWLWKGSDECKYIYVHQVDEQETIKKAPYLQMNVGNTQAGSAKWFHDGLSLEGCHVQRSLLNRTPRKRRITTDVLRYEERELNMLDDSYDNI